MPFYAGFDILQYPNTAMEWLKANTNLVWCGYYLAPAPNRRESTWMGTFASLNGKWGLLPIYVGQQDAGTAHGNYQPSSTLTSEQGAIDGKAACDLVAGERFPSGTFVYLDWEYGGLDGAGSGDYIAAWISAVVGDGRARPGIYCSHAVAPAIAGLINAMNPTPTTRFFCWKVPDADPHPFTGDISSLPEPDPVGCGFTGAQSWQREQQAIVTFPAGAPVTSLMMDFSTSSLADPGAPSPVLLGMEALPVALTASARRRTGTTRKVKSRKVKKAAGRARRTPKPSRSARKSTSRSVHAVIKRGGEDGRSRSKHKPRSKRKK